MSGMKEKERDSKQGEIYCKYFIILKNPHKTKENNKNQKVEKLLKSTNYKTGKE